MNITITKKHAKVAAIVLAIAVALGVLIVAVTRPSLEARVEQWFREEMTKQGAGEYLSKARVDCAVEEIMDIMTDKELEEMLRDKVKPIAIIGEYRATRFATRVGECWYAK